MVDRKASLPVRRQCALLDLPRSTFYHVPQSISDEEFALMGLMDRCHLKHPLYGSRRIRDWLEDQGHGVNHKQVQRLMRTRVLRVQYPDARRSLGQPLAIYNAQIQHQSLDRRTPDSVDHESAARLAA